MKTIWKTLVLAAIVTAVAAPASFAGESAWFDFENCSMCENLTAEKGLMDHTSWKTYRIATGMMTVTVVEAEYQEAMARASANMEKVGQRLMAGEQLPLCGFCRSYGMLMMSGAQMENFDTDAGNVMLVTSTDPATVEAIHKHAQTTRDEYDKMYGDHDTQGGQDDSDDHEGHDY